MSEGNLYAPPKTQVEAESQIGRHDAYRDGAYLIVRNGFVGPKICVKTGVPVEEGMAPLKVMMQQKFTVQSLIYYVILMVGVFCVIFYIERLNERYAFFALLIVLVPLGFWRRSQMDAVKLYCEKGVRKSWSLRTMGGSSLMLGGVIFMNLAISLDWMFAWVIVSLAVMFSGTFLLNKRLLKSEGKEGGYERFIGAHKNFLDTLPVVPYEYDPSQGAKE